MKGERLRSFDDPTQTPTGAGARTDAPGVVTGTPTPGTTETAPGGDAPTTGGGSPSPPGETTQAATGADAGTWGAGDGTRFPRSPEGQTPEAPGPTRRDEVGNTGAETIATEPAPGRVIFGKYLVVKKLGQGGMGQVWQVRHLGLDVDRALKLILSRDGFHRDGLDKVDSAGEVRFRREARVMVRFSHPNAVAVHDAGIRPDGGTAYIEMEFLPGRSLDKVLCKGEPLPLDRVVHILDQLCSVLEVAHGAGIVHRDLKPPNLMLVDGGTPGHETLKVFDFGIAKILGPENHEAVTCAGLPIGTPAYMSPEQILGDSAAIDGRSDLYSVGVILYEFLTGFRPFEGPVMKVSSEHLSASPPPFAARNPAAKVPAAVERVVMRCLEKDRARRPQSAAELARLFREAAYPGSAAAGGGGSRVWTRRRVAAGLALALPAGAAALAWFLRPAPLTLRVIPGALTVVAGESQEVVVQVAPARRGRRPVLAPRDVPVGVGVAPVGAGSGDGVQVFRVSVPLNAAAAGGARRLAFQATAGAARATAALALTIAPPAVRLPGGFAALPGARLVKLAQGVFPDRIARRFDEGPPAVFILVEHRHPDDPDPFYILRDKVWVGLFRKFAAENASAVKGGDVLRGPAAGGVDGDLLPVTRVTYTEADAFARWVAGGEWGRVPSPGQWDTASGLRDRRRRKGPFLDGWAPGEIAVDRKGLGPLPVGAAAKDISPLGCRDMAGNGNEWTRPEGKPDLIELRGQSYEMPTPLLYDEIGSQSESARHRERLPDLGFRTVIEIDGLK